jgi:hypothetical protein
VFEIGSASAVVNPVLPADLGGFSGAARPWRDVASALECNLVLLQQAGRAVLLISLDTLFAGPELTDAVRKLAKEYLGPRSVVNIFASHTHSAPMLDGPKPQLGRASESYLNLIVTHVEKLLLQALADRKPVSGFRKGQGIGHHGINRRLSRSWRKPANRFRSERQVFLAPNPLGKVDNSLRCLLFLDAQQQVLAALIQVACHPSGFPEEGMISADYIDGLRQVLRKRFGRSLPVVFMQGFSGDVRPALKGVITLRYLINSFRGGPTFRPVRKTEWQIWSNNLAVEFEKTLEQLSPLQALMGELAFERLSLPLHDVLDMDEGTRLLEHTRIHLGNAAKVSAVNAEMLVGWKDSFPDEDFTVGCVDDCHCYLPRENEAKAGGYEASRFLPAFGLKARGWRPNYEQKIRAALNLPSDPS